MADDGDGHDLPELFADIHFLATRAGALGAAVANRDLGTLGLRVRSFSVLSLACTSSPQTQKEIAEVLLLDPSQVVMLLDSLESRDLVRRIPDPSDRRARLVTATTAGQALYDAAKQVIDDANSNILGSLSSDEMATLRSLLQRVALNVFVDSRAAS